MSYIPLEDCEHGAVYKIGSRNLSIGVFNKEDAGFIGIREKFGSLYLFTEYHYDTGPPFGTVTPKLKLGVLPEDIRVCEQLDIVDQKTGLSLVYVEGTGWTWKDTGKPVIDVSPVGVENKPLFEYLTEVHGGT